jgi:acyl carrier protein
MDLGPKIASSFEEESMPEKAKERDYLHDAIEKELVAIWADVLRVSSVDLHRDFLDLGGDSLAAILCISRMRSRFGVEFSIEDFFMTDANVSTFAATIAKFEGQSRD